MRTIPKPLKEPQTAARDFLHTVYSPELGWDFVAPGAAFKLNGSTPHPDAAPQPVGADTAGSSVIPAMTPTAFAELAGRGLVTIGG